ncbi:preQ(0) biosynthesis protein QueE [Faunimonas pinastri]|uniref:7-carboxy-7-deazaguanine synthase n=1 Tax=Faunimonas pinastri TaxID=1855383 RepID=A0A1H9P8H2_9HYPH|nr:preQ(0) biosynthesis protein QueE [Faunimonas pinastri]
MNAPSAISARIRGAAEAVVRVSEIFGPTIQGEGALIGLPTVFVRTGGCDYRCSWCDSLHAVDSRYRADWKPMTSGAILDEVRRLSGDRPLTVTISGGNPAIQPLGDLIRQGHERGYRFALETQGSVSQDWFAELDMLVLSPKPPSSGMVTDWQALANCVAEASAGPRTVLKFVVFDEADYAFARDAASRFPALAVYLQPGNPIPEGAEAEHEAVDPDALMRRMEWLIDRVTADRWFEAHVLPQLHVLIWGNRRGV